MNEKQYLISTTDLVFALTFVLLAITLAFLVGRGLGANEIWAVCKEAM